MGIVSLLSTTKDITDLPSTTAIELWYLENPDRVDALNTFVSNNFEEPFCTTRNAMKKQDL